MPLKSESRKSASSGIVPGSSTPTDSQASGGGTRSSSETARQLKDPKEAREMCLFELGLRIMKNHGRYAAKSQVPSVAFAANEPAGLVPPAYLDKSPRHRMLEPNELQILFPQNGDLVRWIESSDAGIDLLIILSFASTLDWISIDWVENGLDSFRHQGLTVENLPLPYWPTNCNHWTPYGDYIPHPMGVPEVSEGKLWDQVWTRQTHNLFGRQQHILSAPTIGEKWFQKQLESGPVFCTFPGTVDDVWSAEIKKRVYNKAASNGFALVDKIWVDPDYWDGEDKYLSRRWEEDSTPTLAPCVALRTTLHLVDRPPKVDRSPDDFSSMAKNTIKAERARLVGEADLTNIVRCFGIIEGNHAWKTWSVLEWAEGGDLGDFFDTGALHQAYGNGPQILRGMMKSLADLAGGIKALHELDIWHGNIRPRNVLVFPDEKSDGNPLGVVFKHTDFGLSSERDMTVDRRDKITKRCDKKLEEIAAMANARRQRGGRSAKFQPAPPTPWQFEPKDNLWYYAPELYAEAPNWSYGPDLWSLGLLAFEWIHNMVYDKSEWSKFLDAAREGRGFTRARSWEQGSDCPSDVTWHITRIADFEIYVEKRKILNEQMDHLNSTAHMHEHIREANQIIRGHLLVSLYERPEDRPHKPRRMTAETFFEKLSQLIGKIPGQATAPGGDITLEECDLTSA